MPNRVQLRQLANANQLVSDPNAKQKAKVADRFGQGPDSPHVDLQKYKCNGVGLSDGKSGAFDVEKCIRHGEGASDVERCIRRGEVHST